MRVPTADMQGLVSLGRLGHLPVDVWESNRFRFRTSLVFSASQRPSTSSLDLDSGALYLLLLQVLVSMCMSLHVAGARRPDHAVFSKPWTKIVLKIVLSPKGAGAAALAVLETVVAAGRLCATKCDMVVAFRCHVFADCIQNAKLPWLSDFLATCSLTVWGLGWHDLTALARNLPGVQSVDRAPKVRLVRFLSC